MYIKNSKIILEIHFTEKKMESLNFLGGMKNPFVLRFWPR